jgi:cytoskeletal protein CcmA (bactofilin family)
MFNNKVEKTIEQDVSSSNILGKGTFLDGNVESFGNIRIEGKIHGSVKSKSKIVLGQSSVIQGDVIAQNAEIAGEVTGTIEVTEQLILRPSAIIGGDIITNKLIVESGASFNGSCKMGVANKEIKIEENGKSSKSAEPKPAPEARPS